MLSDLGEAVQGDEARHHNAQPDVHRAPEVMLKADWSYAVDIWNVGTMVSPFPTIRYRLLRADEDLRRSGISLKANICSVDVIQTGEATPREHISQR